MSFYKANEDVKSTIDQASGNQQCFWYSVKCANEISTINLAKLGAKAPSQMGGNGCSIWKDMAGMGLNFLSGLGKEAIINGITTAIEHSLPTILLTSWKQGKNKGNHCVYICGINDGVIVARDQQNQHKVITFDTNNKPTWSSIAWENGRVYTLTSISVGGADKEALKPVYKAIYP